MNENETTTPTRKRLPRWDFQNRPPNADALTEPLPKMLSDAIADAPEARRHREVAANYGAAKEKVRELEEKLQQARADDEDRAREALAAGKARPAPRSPKYETERDQAADDRRLLAEAIVGTATIDGTATALLRVAVERLPDVLERAEQEKEAALVDVSDSIDAVVRALDRGDEVAGVSGWLTEVAQSGIAKPFRLGPQANVSPKARGKIRETRDGFEEDRFLVAERLAAREREEASELPLPVGSVVWRDARSFVVGADGELEEVER